MLQFSVHAYALSTALKANVNLVYPMRNKKIRAFVNATIHPISNEEISTYNNTTLNIMWSTTQTCQYGSWFQQNHFVPLVPCSSISSPSNSVHLQKAGTTNRIISGQSKMQDFFRSSTTECDVYHDRGQASEKSFHLAETTEGNVSVSTQEQVLNQDIICG